MKVKYTGEMPVFASAGPKGTESKEFPNGKTVEVSAEMGGFLIARGDFEEVKGGAASSGA
jgi:hypothetical protein